jgi:hypothetical protein
LIDTVVIALSLSWFALLGNISFTALGLISVVAIIIKISNKNIKSVIDDAENEFSTLDPLLIAIVKKRF